jgi:hypothetical protein
LQRMFGKSSEGPTSTAGRRPPTHRAMEHQPEPGCRLNIGGLARMQPVVAIALSAPCVCPAIGRPWQRRPFPSRPMTFWAAKHPSCGCHPAVVVSRCISPIERFSAHADLTRGELRVKCTRFGDPNGVVDVPLGGLACAIGAAVMNPPGLPGSCVEGSPPDPGHLVCGVISARGVVPDLRRVVVPALPRADVSPPTRRWCDR